jgi:hypothetical protein
MATQLTARDLDILHALTHCVRLFSIQQIAGCWWKFAAKNSTALRDRIRILVECGWVRRGTVFARPLPHIEQPLFVWRPREPAPAFDTLAWKSQSRWSEAAKTIPVIVASDKSSRRFFGRRARGIRQGFQTTHDLGVAEVYLRFREQFPSQISQWRGERMIAHLRRRKKVPDAVIADESLWPPILVVEFAGEYSARRLRQFHHVCVKEQLPYQLW